MTKKISGSWIEFKHHCKPESKYYEDAIENFTDEQWDEKVKEQADLGFKYLVLMSVALEKEAFFKTSIFPRAKVKCEDPLEALLSATDKYGIKVFISTGIFFMWNDIDEYHTDKYITVGLNAANEVFSKYRKHKSFFGWYYPVEAHIDGLFKEEYIHYVNKHTAELKKIIPSLKTLIAPFGTRDCFADDRYVKQLESLEIDYIAYQDEVGVQKTKVDELEKIYEKLKKAHDKAGRAEIWADIEIFDFEGVVYKSALLPAPFSRVKQQLEIISPFVKTILVYQYLGLMNKPNTKAFAGHDKTTSLYTEYSEWLKKKARKEK